MPKVKSKSRKPEPEVYDVMERTQISSVIFGLVMVVAIIVAGAAMLGGSLSQAGKRWGSAMDGVSRSVGLSVRSVEVIGLEHLSPVARQVKDAAMILEGENMFRADPHQIRQRVVATRLVANVRVYRLWPDTVIIRADAARPTALWYDGDVWTVVDSLGQVMPKQLASDHLDLMRLSGADAPAAMTELQAALADTPALQTGIRMARRVAGRRWDIELTNGAIVRLPADKDLGTSLARLADVDARTALTQRALKSIDMRVPGRFVLTPRAPESAEREAA